MEDVIVSKHKYFTYSDVFLRCMLEVIEKSQKKGPSETF